MSDGAEPRENVATLSSDTVPRRADGTVSEATASWVLRFAAFARRWTSYCSPPSL